MQLRIVWFALVILRFLLVLLPQTGYIHPDEFFQSVEPMAGGVLGYYAEVPWEFTTESPIRSILFPIASAGVPYKLLHLLSGAHITTYQLLVVPRLLMTAFTLLIDYALYQTCVTLEVPSQSTAAAMTMYASSYVVLTYYTRTFSNTAEAAIFAILYYLVASSCAKYKRRVQSDASIWIGVLLAVGVFTRATFLIFAATPLLVWLYALYKSRGAVREPDVDEKMRDGDKNNAEGSDLRDSIAQELEQVSVWEELLGFVSGFIIISVYCITMDTSYYSLSQLDGEQHAAHYPSLFAYIWEVVWEAYYKGGVYGVIVDGVAGAVVTPVNFIRYNVNPDNLSSHGLHPRYVHLLLNLQLLYGVLPAYVIYRLYTRRRVLQPRVTLHAAAVAVPVVALSLVSHQEARFLIPVLMPLVLVYCTSTTGSQRVTQPRWVTLLWVAHNLAMLAMFGFLHQGGVVPAMSHVAHRVTERPGHSYHVIFYHTYTPPRHLLAYNITRHNHPRVRVYDLKGSKRSELVRQVSEVLSSVQFDSYDLEHQPGRQQHIVYVAAPATLDHHMCGEKYRSAGEGEFQFKLVASFPYHLSMEDPPRWWPGGDTSNDTTCNSCSDTCSAWDKVKHTLSLNLYEVVPDY